jgi:hypothetical protein
MDFDAANKYRSGFVITREARFVGSSGTWRLAAYAGRRVLGMLDCLWSCSTG